MRTSAVLLLLPLLVCGPARADEQKVIGVPQTVTMSDDLHTKPVESPVVEQPAAQQAPAAKAIEIKPPAKPQKGGQKKKGGRQTRDELVESLQTRIKALEAQQDKDVVNGQISGSIQRPVNSMSVESKTIYNYVPDAIYLIYGAINHVVDIQLQPGEKLSGAPVAGDTVRWIVGTTVSGSGSNAVTHVLVKPVHPNIETNFLVTTDRHSYRLYAKSSESFFIPTVGWNYPDEAMVEYASAKKEQQRLDAQVVGSSLVAADLNFKYKISPDGDYPWTPVRVFDDGAKTYIQMAPGMKHTEAPAFFIKEDKVLNLVNYRVKSDYFVVDRLFDEGELRCGKKDVVFIEKEKSRWWFGSDKQKKDARNRPER
jgi:type IV secretion system protein VirB9